MFVEKKIFSGIERLISVTVIACNGISIILTPETNEPRHEKTRFLPRRKQSRRSASQSLISAMFSLHG